MPAMNNPAPFRTVAAKALACGLALAASVSAYVGQWHSYTDQGRVTALASHEGHVYAATYGGIRRIDTLTLAETSYDNLSGLTDAWITGLVVDTHKTLWAVSRDGFLYTLRGNRWETWGRSYASLQWKMNPRAVLAENTHLYLGSEKGLSLFRAQSKVADLNITRFRDELGLSVLSLLRRGDTLYVGTSGGVFKARVNFKDPLNPPLGFANLADPSVWIRVNFPADTTRRFDHLAFIGDSLATFGRGTLLQQPLRVEAFADSPLVIGARKFDSTWTGFTTALFAGGRLFVGGDQGLAVSSNPGAAAPTATFHPPAVAYPRDTIFALGAKDGHLWSHTVSGIYGFDSWTGAFNAVAAPVIAPSPELLYRYLRNVTLGPHNTVYIGTWGGGLVRISPAGERVWKRDTDTCIVTDDPGDPWTVVSALSAPSGRDLYFTTYRLNPSNTHQIVHLDLQTDKITCPAGGSSVPGGNPRAVQTFGDTLLGVATNAGVSFFRTQRGISSVTLQSLGNWTIPGTAQVAWDLAKDRWDRVWTLIGPNLAYLDSLQNSTTNEFQIIDNFVGQDCKNLEEDPAGLLWVGCANGLFQVTTEPGGELGNVRRYGLDDGLLSTQINDIAIDSSTGRVWVATDRGVSMFESASQPALENNALPPIVPYPNPFRPQHRVVIFDKLPRNATLRLQDADGRVVRIFHPRDLTGNQAQWDGRNEQGKPVAPGVYLFSVVSGSAVQRGKVIVAR
jgi:hypothetical protein